jgi:type IV secretory pathway VirB2 component (pilin)
VYPGISYRPGDSSINGYSGDAIASYNNGQTYVQLKSGQWVNAQQYTPAMDNPPPQPQNNVQNGGSNEPIAATLCLISNALQGPIGKTVATIAVVVLGVGLFLGKLSWPLAVATAIGIGLIFGSSEMVSWLSNQSGSGC